MSMFKMIAVTSRRLSRRSLPEQIDRIAGVHGPDMVILREKDMPEEEYRVLAAQVMEVCEKRDILCILHSYPETARALGCPHIHLPFATFQKCWKELSDFQIRGTSVHSVEDARWAEEHGADYVTAGHVYVTDCKKGVKPRGISFLEEVCKAVVIPVYGIGGITEEKLEDIRKAGAAGACMMSGFMEKD